MCEPHPAEAAWLLRGLVVCDCGARSVVNQSGPNRHFVNYYVCPSPARVSGQPRTCQERSVRADALDSFAFNHIRAALLTPDTLLAGRHAHQGRQTVPDDRLLGAELALLDRHIDATGNERRRLADLYQAGIIDPDDPPGAPATSIPAANNTPADEMRSSRNATNFPRTTTSATKSTTSPPQSLTPSTSSTSNNANGSSGT
jgi:hypothetical protein